MSVLRFKTQFGEFKRMPVDLSNSNVDVYEVVQPGTINKETGKLYFEGYQPRVIKTGSYDMYEYIQSFKDDTDIYKLLKRVGISGDTSLLQVSNGVYADISDIPENIHDFKNIYNNVINAKNKIDIDTIVNNKDVNNDNKKESEDNK